MSPFGLLIIIYLLKIILKKESIIVKFENLVAATISVELFIEVGYMFKVGSYELLYSQFMTIIVILYSLLIIFKKTMDFKIIFSGYIMIICLLLGILSQLILPFEEQIIVYGMGWENFFRGDMQYPTISFQSWLILFRFIGIVLIAIACTTVFNKTNIENIIRKIIKIGTFILGFIIIEWIFKNVFHSQITIHLVNMIFGEGSGTIEFLLERGKSFSLQGLMKEPSHLGASLFNYGILILISHYDRKEKKRLLILLVIIMFISGSFRACLNGIILVGVFYLLNYNFINISIFVIIGILLITLTLPFIFSSNFIIYYINRFIKMWNTLLFNENYNLATSELRIVTIIETYKVFLKNPLVGIGLGTTYAFGFLPTFLSTAGVVGVLSWYNFLFKDIGRYYKNPKNILILVILIIIWNLQGQMEPAYALITLFFSLEFRYL